MLKRSIKTIHIHTDQKFISDSLKFEGECFNNNNILISNSVNDAIKNDMDITIFKPTPKSIKKIVKMCIDADLVVLYDLEGSKVRIALMLPKNIPIAWRFFGHELYGQEKEKYLSKKTLQVQKLRPIQKFRDKYVKPVISSISILKWGMLTDKSYTNAINRIDFFLCFSREEYELFKSKWLNPPHFVQLPVPPSFKDDPGEMEKKKLIILGNNRSSYNNNLDIIEIIDASENRNQFDFILLFNYGPESNYSKAVRLKTKDKSYYKLINKFMNMDEFLRLYREAGAAIFNGYRQMALGNILAAIQYGVKLYLNDNNLIKNWLLDRGITVYSISELDKDLKEGSIFLTNNEAMTNRENLRIMIDSYSYQDFRLSIYSKLVDIYGTNESILINL
ncbi:MAG: hypothetical protein ACQERS_05180 [Bacteroidota bacterium]